MCYMYVSAWIYVSVYKNQSHCKVYVQYHVYSFVLATACAVYASKVLPNAAHTLAVC
jgi:hypothetical protein